MGGILKIMAMGMLGLLFSGANGAAEQNLAENQLSAAITHEKYDASALAKMLTEFGISSSVAAYENDGSVTLLAETPGSARFVVSMFDCDAPERGLGCRTALIFTGLSNAGMAYDDINTFNANSEVTRAVNVPEENIIIFGRQLYFEGGVGPGNIKLIVMLFLIDMQRHVNLQSATGTTISYKEANSVGASKAENDVLPNNNSEAPPKVYSSPATVEKSVDAAIANNWRAKFITIKNGQ